MFVVYVGQAVVGGGVLNCFILAFLLCTHSMRRSFLFCSLCPSLVLCGPLSLLSTRCPYYSLIITTTNIYGLFKTLPYNFLLLFSFFFLGYEFKINSLQVVVSFQTCRRLHLLNRSEKKKKKVTYYRK